MATGNVRKVAYFALNKCTIFTKHHCSKYRSIPYHNNDMCNVSFKSLHFSCRRHFNDHGNGKNDVTLDWENSDDIADLLFEEYKNVDPLTLRFEELENMIIDTVVHKNKKKLSGRCNENVLENIQMNWLDRYNEENN
ncbi:iron-sulfur assembly protein, putative [Plasmodium ovale wallikeri]|uniref:Iron-sulfur assembly protein, putative n=2 Tax=Plasmodium ovale TaxID=36330 RepID=A0A1A8YZE6_PLAOA|nr:iron-sulfur assembly protein, putative [Plasmodium ovale wallikeri]SBT37673.1 iron-sulfur assembly protein, putative [Plasmodium ovale wallikeri]SBT77541.1 iron-sulfur assembly protein, putative [Plasmodium ovale]